ncbi:MAG TPA: VWA domain-containing protein [Pyrinomonadaceae bacterium]|nr:VWA domain-containing protein [Pyrinomonadaceae bacterium]
MRAELKLTTLLLIGLVAASIAAGQAGRRTAPAGEPVERGVVLNVVARAEDPEERVTAAQVSLYDGGMEQSIQSFVPDRSPAHIVLLLDNSLRLRADVEKLQQTVREFAYEIYEGDKLMVVGYDRNAEIITDWTDDAKVIEGALSTIRKSGEPHLYDALAAVLNDALVPLTDARRKRVVVLVGDGLDRGSKTSFDRVHKDLLRYDITVYALQIPDRTGGALRREQLKPAQVIRKLTEETGGRVLTVNEPREAAKAVCDELRKNRYLLAYTPRSIPLTDARRLLVLGAEGVSVRHKLAHP